MKWWNRLKQQPFFIRLLHWEYWPATLFYWPLSPYFFWLFLRSGHPCFFTAANPGIYTGGLGMESKFKTFLKIPGRWRPRTVMARPGVPFNTILRKMDEEGITFPIIVKPDIGFRGFLVKKIDDPQTLRQYLQGHPIDILIQEYIDLPVEVGILYHRFPGESRGRITSVTLKQFLSVTGDGRSTVRSLVMNSQRARLQLKQLETLFPALLERVPPAGITIPLGVIGNHSRGTKFMDGGHLVDEQLIATFDQIAASIEGYHYGRFDIRCRSWEDMKAGRNFRIIELNGVCSEPAHIYDPEKSSYLSALRTIARHWDTIARIAVSNHALGVPYMRPWPMIKAIRELTRYVNRVRRLAR